MCAHACLCACACACVHVRLRVRACAFACACTCHACALAMTPKIFVVYLHTFESFPFGQTDTPMATVVIYIEEASRSHRLSFLYVKMHTMQSVECICRGCVGPPACLCALCLYLALFKLCIYLCIISTTLKNISSEEYIVEMFSQ